MKSHLPMIDPMTAQHPPSQELFAYGSLMCADIMTLVAGVALTSSPAAMPGYRRVCVRDEQYPGVVVDAAASVAGLVYHHIPLSGWKRLDAFEGEMYERKPVVALLADGTQTQVSCYIFRPEFHHRLTTEAWDFAAFLKNGKQAFQNRYCGFRVIDADQMVPADNISPGTRADTQQTF